MTVDIEPVGRDAKDILTSETQQFNINRLIIACCVVMMKKKDSKTPDKVLKKPVRGRILGWLSGRKGPKTKSEIGKALSLSNAAVHYHMRLLEEVDLVTLEETRLGPNGITEKLYLAKPLNSKEAQMTDKEKSDFYLRYTLDTMTEMQREGEALITSDWENARFIAGCYKTFATDEEIVALKEKISIILEEFFYTHKIEKKGASPQTITLGILPSKAAGWDASDQTQILDMLS